MSQQVPEKAAQPASPAAKLFAEFVTRQASPGAPDLETFCRAHPALARELQLLAAHWERVLGVIEELELQSSLHPPASAAPPGADPRSAQVLQRLAGRRTAASRYSVQEEVARGGMGAILRVWDEDLRRSLAMKVVVTQAEGGTPGGTRAVDSILLGRFLEEAQITSQLEHPGIVPVHELGLDPDGRVFFTMRLVSGRNLERIFELVSAGEEGWTRTRAVGVVLKICEAMAYAHDKGVIHRDLKPANVMVGRFGEVYVMDWGLARVLGDEGQAELDARAQQAGETTVRTDRLDLRHSGTSSGLNTMDGDIVGTPAYMSPEQARGALASVGPISDVYSTGAILYHLLAGHMPYALPGTEPTVVEIWQKARAESPEPLHERAPEAPVELVAICEKAMAREPGERYASMLELAEDLRAYLEGRVVQAYETGAVAEFKKWVVRNKGLAVTTLVALAVILAGTTAAALVLADKNLKLGVANAESRASEKKAVESEKVAQQNAAIADERARRILRLSDLKRYQELSQQADALWPVHPSKVPALEDWLARARELVLRLPQHRAALEELRLTALAPDASEDPAQRSWKFARPEEDWLHDLQAELVADIESLSEPEHGRIADISQRLEFARTIEERSISGAEARALWSEALASIARADGAYGGLVLQPQLGLLPLGEDPRSHLWEFAHLQSGAPAVRDAASGELALAEGTGVVFVLLPGGTFDMGAQNDDPDAPNYDLGADVKDEGPVHEVALAPFFCSKYELTQAQWLRFAGRNPSIYAPGNFPVATTLLHPVEQVSWQDCTALLGKLALQLPTEAQWEYAARAGTATAWWTGSEKETLAGACNLADPAAQRYGATWPGIETAPELDDGFVVTAPCGSFLPNPFGLHDVCGNVWEWCRDSVGRYDLEVAPGDGERQGGNPINRMNRGGSFFHAAAAARSANRNNSAADMRINQLGVRPALAVH